MSIFVAGHQSIILTGVLPIVIARGNDVATPVTFNIKDIGIHVNENVKVLGIHFDDKLKFNEHISELCKRASRHINDISRVSEFLLS